MRSWCPIRYACMVVCCTRWDGTNGGPGRSFAEPSSYYYARNAAGWRARRRFWRGTVFFFSFFFLLLIFPYFLLLGQSKSIRL